eukprot:scaffold181375_cov14-Tisochrysis_lutea.AAC.1
MERGADRCGIAKVVNWGGCGIITFKYGAEQGPVGHTNKFVFAYAALATYKLDKCTTFNTLANLGSIPKKVE